jgi:hypothetical protein
MARRMPVSAAKRIVEALLRWMDKKFEQLGLLPSNPFNKFRDITTVRSVVMELRLHFHILR